MEQCGEDWMDRATPTGTADVAEALDERQNPDTKKASLYQRLPGFQLMYSLSVLSNF